MKWMLWHGVKCSRLSRLKKKLARAFSFLGQFKRLSRTNFRIFICLLFHFSLFVSPFPISIFSIHLFSIFPLEFLFLCFFPSQHLPFSPPPPPPHFHSHIHYWNDKFVENTSVCLLFWSGVDSLAHFPMSCFNILTYISIANCVCPPIIQNYKYRANFISVGILTW